MKRNFQLLSILGILFIAAFLRLYRIADYMTFLGDEGRDALVAYNILHGHLTLLGPTASVGGFFLGPIYYYFMAPFLWLFNYNPVGPSVMVALFGIATVFLVYKVGTEFFNSTVGLIAAALYSISPLVIAYSRSSWNPNLMPFFSLLLLFILYKAVISNKALLFILCGFLLGIAMQLHYLSIFLGVIAALYVFIIRRFVKKGRTLWNYLFLSLGFVIGLFPFLVFEIRHDFANVKSIWSFIFAFKDTGGNGHFLSTFFNVLFRLFGRLTANSPPQDQIAAGIYKNIGLWSKSVFILELASIAVFLYKWLKAKSGKKAEDFSKLSLILVWLVVGAGLFGFYKKPIYDYYLGFMFPLPFFLVGLFLSTIFTKRWGKILGSIILITIIWLNLNGIPFKNSPNRQLAQVEKISKAVMSKTDGRPFNFALIAAGNSDHGYRYFFTLSNRNPSIIQTIESDPNRTSVTDQLLIVCETLPCHPLGHSLWEVAGFGRAEIVDSWDVSVVKVYKLKHYKGE